MYMDLSASINIRNAGLIKIGGIFKYNVDWIYAKKGDFVYRKKKPPALAGGCHIDLNLIRILIVNPCYPKLLSSGIVFYINANC